MLSMNAVFTILQQQFLQLNNNHLKRVMRDQIVWQICNNQSIIMVQNGQSHSSKWIGWTFVIKEKAACDKKNKAFLILWIFSNVNYIHTMNNAIKMLD